MPRITLTLPSELATALRSEASRDDRPMSSIARRAFHLYFAGRHRTAAAPPHSSVTVPQPSNHTTPSLPTYHHEHR